jgi:predicted nucleotidyltransferase component of viral defense system
MLSGKMYTDEYIRELQNRTGNDPALLERVVYAFGLLEAIRRVELPFCFKGGTSLMLLLEHPGRLSTDIDIVVEPGTAIDPLNEREIFETPSQKLLIYKACGCLV